MWYYTCVTQKGRACLQHVCILYYTTYDDYRMINATQGNSELTQTSPRSPFRDIVSIFIFRHQDKLFDFVPIGKGMYHYHHVMMKRIYGVQSFTHICCSPFRTRASQPARMNRSQTHQNSLKMYLANYERQKACLITTN